MKRNLFGMILFSVLVTAYFIDKQTLPGSTKKDNAVSMIKENKFSAVPDSGKILYQMKCMSCHQINGTGVPGMYPPLMKSEWVNGDKQKLIKVVLEGLEGEIQVNGTTFVNSMPKQDLLTNKQIAEILTYVRSNFENNSTRITVVDVFSVRKK